jgi:helix-turn-helix protein
MGMPKKNAITKVGKAVVTYGDSVDDTGRQIVSARPRRVVGDGSSARGPPTVDRLLTTVETADLLRIPPNTLEKWRTCGAGPRFVKVGANVRYRPADVSTYINKRTRSSTSEAPAA